MTHIFAVCTPYTPPAGNFIPLENIVKSKLPNFGYQIQLASGAVEEHIQTKDEIKQFLNGMYGGSGASGEGGFDVTKGVLFENLEKLGKTPLLSEEMLEYYVDQYARNGMHGSCKYSINQTEVVTKKVQVSWYRTREQNFQEELQ